MKKIAFMFAVAAMAVACGNEAKFTEQDSIEADSLAKVAAEAARPAVEKFYKDAEQAKADADSTYQIQDVTKLVEDSLKGVYQAEFDKIKAEKLGTQDSAK